jgi:alginate O-acetyltransferase complex protein AlgI
VAGPIVRYAQVRENLHRRGPDKILFSFGMYRFLIGLNKKLIIANNVSVVADTAFTLSANGGIGCPDAWIGITAYAIQIYFDFSAYSDMAIGLAAMAGFRFEENFTRPYSSKSIREFWRRWHISLSSWLKDYLYIPLGGNRQGKAATYRNLVLVFLLCGLWHGAEFTFIIWGLWHGLFLVIERMAPDSIGRLAPAFVGRLYAFVVVLIGWVFFRADNTGLALQYLGDMFSFNFVAPDLSYHTVGCLTLGVGVLSCLIPDRFLPAPASRNPDAFPVPFFVFQIVLAAASIALLLTGARNPFIYFNF